MRQHIIKCCRSLVFSSVQYNISLNIEYFADSLLTYSLIFHISDIFSRLFSSWLSAAKALNGKLVCTVAEKLLSLKEGQLNRVEVETYIEIVHMGVIPNCPPFPKLKVPNTRYTEKSCEVYAKASKHHISVAVFYAWLHAALFFLLSAFKK